MASLDGPGFLSFPLTMKIFFGVTVAFFALAGCASTRDSGSEGSLAGNMGAAAGSTVSQTGGGLSDAALSPLDDLNLRRREIPPLLAALDSPYIAAVDLTCEQVAEEVLKLDGVLGPDWDQLQPDERLRTEVLADEAANAALGAVESGMTGWIPFRGLLRKATGAESHEKRYNQAFKIGAQRRAYLKGFGLAKGCDGPARPDFLTLGASEIETAPPSDPGTSD
jgi:hypothetical protein